MPHSTKPIAQLNSHLRVVRDEDAPPYDAVPSPKMAGGFAMMPFEVMDRLTGDGDAMAVFFAISKHANKDGECWPSIAKLMEITGYSDRHVRDKINHLVELKLITKTPRSGGMKSVNVYRICQKIPEVQSGTQYRTSGTRNRTDRHVVPDSAVPGAGRTISSELDPIELDVPANAGKEKKPLPKNGIAQQIVAAYCEAAGIDAPAVYGKAVGLAKLIANAGVTVDDIPSLYAFAAEWKGTADLGLMLNQIDRWRAKPVATGANGRAPKLPEDIQRRMDKWLEESRELGLDRPMAPTIVRDIEAWKQAQHIGSLT